MARVDSLLHHWRLLVVAITERSGHLNCLCVELHNFFIFDLTLASCRWRTVYPQGENAVCGRSDSPCLRLQQAHRHISEASALLHRWRLLLCPFHGHCYLAGDVSQTRRHQHIRSLLIRPPTSATSIYNTNASPYRILGWVSYCAIESFGSIGVSLFWAFTNSTYNLEGAKKSYGLMVACAQCAHSVRTLFARLTCIFTQARLDHRTYASERLYGVSGCSHDVFLRRAVHGHDGHFHLGIHSPLWEWHR